MAEGFGSTTTLLFTVKGPFWRLILTVLSGCVRVGGRENVGQAGRKRKRAVNHGATNFHRRGREDSAFGGGGGGGGGGSGGGIGM